MTGPHSKFWVCVSLDVVKLIFLSAIIFSLKFYETSVSFGSPHNFTLIILCAVKIYISACRALILIWFSSSVFLSFHVCFMHFFKYCTSPWTTVTAKCASIDYPRESANRTWNSGDSYRSVLSRKVCNSSCNNWNSQFGDESNWIRNERIVEVMKRQWHYAVN